MIPQDKLLHFGAGLLIALAVGLLLSPWLALPAAVIAGGLKELYDSRHPETHAVDALDFIATGFGGVLGAWLVW